MVINHFLDGDTSLAVDSKNQPHLSGQPQRVLALSIPGQRVEIERSDLEQVLEAIGGEERIHSLHITSTDVRPPGPNRVCGSYAVVGQEHDVYQRVWK